jgi:hypothetical protein
VHGQEVEAGGDVLGHQRGGVAVAVAAGERRVDAHDVQVVGVPAGRRAPDRVDARQPLEPAVVPLDEAQAVPEQLVEPVELRQCDGRLQVGEVGLESRRHHVVVAQCA